ncbi:MAG: tRNA dihydrouridine synthase DusB [Frankiales bacterium]|nr:tRNA dihydrouridine synthase DusB [Frankiales bacterium]
MHDNGPMTSPGHELLRRGGVPVVLAPMAGITNRAFRRLAREQARSATSGSATGIYVTEMITSRALVERNDETMAMIATDPDESPRSVQLYGVDPATVGAAVRLLVAEDRADHVDLNFGCPVAKVTRKGGGSALPWKRGLFRAIVREAVRTADDTARAVGREPVPVTVKMRTGVDPEHLTYLEAGRAAAEEGAAWVALHGRTASQLYGGTADWTAIARLVEELAPYGVPVLGNGDIWTHRDARRMVEQTGADGVVVGRGCLGRPWLFGQLAADFSGLPVPADPGLRTVAEVMHHHAALLAEVLGPERGPRDFRKHIAWYLKGFAVRRELRQGLAMASSLEEIDGYLAELDLDQPWPGEVSEGPRGRTQPGKRVALPDGWLDDPDDLDGFLADISAAELSVSGG